MGALYKNLSICQSVPYMDPLSPNLEQLKKSQIIIYIDYQIFGKKISKILLIFSKKK